MLARIRKTTFDDIASLGISVGYHTILYSAELFWLVWDTSG